MTSWYTDSDILRLLHLSLGSRAFALNNAYIGKTIDAPILPQLGGKTVVSEPLFPYGKHTIFSELENLLGQVKGLPSAQLPQKMLIPIQVNGGGGRHWVSLFVALDPANPDAAKIAYVNSLGFGSYTEDQAILDTMTRLFPGGIITKTVAKFQQDGHSCGPIVVETLKTLSESPDPIAIINNGEYERSWVNGTRSALALREQQQALLSTGSIPSGAPHSSPSSPPVKETAAKSENALVKFWKEGKWIGGKGAVVGATAVVSLCAIIFGVHKSSEKKKSTESQTWAARTPAPSSPYNGR